MIDRMVGECGSIDILVNNAQGFDAVGKTADRPRMTPMAGLDDDEWDIYLPHRCHRVHMPYAAEAARLQIPLRRFGDPERDIGSGRDIPRQ